MNTHTFIQLLAEHPEKSLFFEYETGQFIRQDYHITEVKNVTFDTVDCGGVQNQWKETHIQLWESQQPELEHAITASKAIKILQEVNRVRETYTDTEVKFEYGNPSFHTAVLSAENMLVHDNKIVVQLQKESTTCKAKDRLSNPEEKAMACCGTPSGTGETEMTKTTVKSGCC